MEMAKESGQQGWWHAYGDIHRCVYIALETDATSLHLHAPTMIPAPLQTPAYAHALIGETIPLLTVEETDTRLKVWMRRQHRIHDLTRPLRLWVILDEAALRRVVGTPDVMREQLEHLNALGAEPHITVEVLPHTAGAHPGLSGQSTILLFADSSAGSVVHLERFTSDLYLEKPSDVQHYRMLLDHLQAQVDEVAAAAGAEPRFAS